MRPRQHGIPGWFHSFVLPSPSRTAPRNIDLSTVPRLSLLSVYHLVRLKLDKLIKLEQDTKNCIKVQGASSLFRFGLGCSDVSTGRERTSGSRDQYRLLAVVNGLKPERALVMPCLDPLSWQGTESHRARSETYCDTSTTLDKRFQSRLTLLQTSKTTKIQYCTTAYHAVEWNEHGSRRTRPCFATAVNATSRLHQPLCQPDTH